MANVTEQQLMELRIKIENKIKLTKDEKKILKDNDKEAIEKKKNMSFGERLKLSSGSDYAQLMGKDEIDNYAIRDWICTGNRLLNAQISGDPYLGMPSGRIWQLAGINSSGKTFIMRKTVANAQKLGYYFVLIESEMANNDKKELIKSGIDIENMLFVPTITVEEMSKTVNGILDELLPTDKVIIGIDSLGNLSTTKEVEDTTEGNETADMTRARKLRAFFRTITVKAGMKNVPIIPVNHTYAIIGGFGGRELGGGEGSKYNSSIINEFTKAQVKSSDQKETIGACITSTATKCRTAKEKTKVKFDIDFDDGLTLHSGLLEFCIDEKLLVKDKQSYKYAPSLKSESFYVEESFSKAKLTPVFWEQFLQKYLAEHMRTKFRYQSSTEGILTEEELAEYCE